MKTNNPQLQLFQVSEIQIHYSRKVLPLKLSKAVSSETVYDIFIASWDMSTLSYQEEFRVMYLNRANKVLGIHLHSTGGITGTVVDIRQVLAVALKANAVSFILAHNHPSGNEMPSQADLEMTRAIKTAAEYMNLKLLDHLIITDETYYSFADEGDL